MPATADPDAVPDRVLRHAGGGDRTAPGPLVLAARSLVPRQGLHHSGFDPDQYDRDAAHDPAGRYGSDPGEDDDLHDAAHAGMVQLALRIGTRPVLDRRQHYRSGTADDHQPHRTGARDGRST